MKTINLRTEPVIRSEDYSDMPEDHMTGMPEDRPIHKPRHRLKLILALGAGFLAVCALGAGVAIHKSGSGTDGAAEGAGDSKANSSTGAAMVCLVVVDPEHGVTPLVPTRPGRVVEVMGGDSNPIRENQEVEKGTVLLRIDDRLASLEVERAYAGLEAANAELRAAQEAHKRKQYLYDVKQLSQEELNASAELVNKANAAVNAREAELEQAKLGVEECEVKAPAKGTILRVLTTKGEVFGPHSRQPAMIFCPSGPRVIRAEVEQEFANRVKVGQNAVVQDHTGGPGTWTGKVSRVADAFTQKRSSLPEMLQLNEIRTLECVIQLNPDQPPLRIGQRMRVTIER